MASSILPKRRETRRLGRLRSSGYLVLFAGFLAWQGSIYVRTHHEIFYYANDNNTSYLFVQPANLGPGGTILNGKQALESDNINNNNVTIVVPSTSPKTITTTSQGMVHQYNVHPNRGNGSRSIVSSRWPSPTLVVGLPKAGTSSIAEYFKCGGVSQVSHHRCQNRACGALIQRNLNQHHPPFFRTGRYNVYAQMDVDFNVQKGLPCFFPQIEAMEEIHAAHPKSAFIINTRNATEWVHSIKRWSGMDQRLAMCNITGFPSPTSNQNYSQQDSDLESFFHAHTLRIRQFVQKHPSHRLVEVSIDSPDAGITLENAFGIDRSCWGHANSNSQQLQR